jgi:hypothetical protein
LPDEEVVAKDAGAKTEVAPPVGTSDTLPH